MASQYPKLEKHIWEINKYRVGYRDIASATNERTLVSAIMPKTFHGNKLPTVIPYNVESEFPGPDNAESLFLTSILSSFVMDFIIGPESYGNPQLFLSIFIANTKANCKIMWQRKLIFEHIVVRAAILTCTNEKFADLWEKVYSKNWNTDKFWYFGSEINDYGPNHERDIRLKILKESKLLKNNWETNLVRDSRMPDRRDIGKRAQLRAEIDAYIAHLYRLQKSELEYILRTFTVLEKNEIRAFGEFQSLRKCLEEFDRIDKIFSS